MRLSDAMREGAKQNPKGIRAYAQWSDDGKTVYTCAIGAAMVGEWGLERMQQCGFRGSMMYLNPSWFAVLSSTAQCPARERLEAIDDIITWLNDRAGWTREAIADWLQTLGY